MGSFVAGRGQPEQPISQTNWLKVPPCDPSRGIRIGQNMVYLYIFKQIHIAYTVLWQRTHQICGQVRCIYTYIYGSGQPYIYGVMAEKSPNIRSSTVCIYTVLADPPYTVLLAGKSPDIRSSTVCIYTVLADPTYTVLWQGNHQIYGQVRCVYIQFWPTLHIRCYGRVITRYTVKYGVYIYSSGRP